MTDTLLKIGDTAFYCEESAALDAEFLWREIFALHDYCRHGVHIEPGATVVDVGANIGLFSLYAAQLIGPDGRVLAVEALAPNFRLLQKNTAHLPTVTCVQAAVGSFAEDGTTAKFCYYPFSPANSSSVTWKLEQDAECRPWLGAWETIPATLCPLSSIQSTYGFGDCDIDLLKIDTEGCELEVLDGLTPPDLYRTRQIVADANHPSYAERIASLLEQRGFRVTVDLPAWTSSQAPCDNRTVFAVRA